MIKVLNICRYLPIDGFPAENDITLKIYADLKQEYDVNSKFIMPLSHIPKWATYMKGSLNKRYKIINQQEYIDAKHQLPIHFFQGNFPIPFRLNKKNNFMNMKLQFLFYKRNLFSQVKNFNPNVVHAHTIDDAFYAYKIFKKCQIPYIITLRGSFSDKYKIPLVKTILKNAKQILTPSFQLEYNLKSSYEIDLLPHGLDSDWYKVDSKMMDTTKLRLITVARLLEMKNIHIVLKTLAILKKENILFNYEIVGDGAYKKDLEILVKKLDLQKEVNFRGKLIPTQIRKLYDEQDIFIMLSESETFGRAYFEAAAQGILIIGTKGTGIDGYFTDAEAFIIEPIVEETLKVLKSFNKDLFQTMTKNSKAKVLKMKNEFIIKSYNDKLLRTANENS